MVMVLAVPKDRLQPRKLLGRDLREQLRSGGAVVEARSRDQHRDQQTERIDQQMPLPALNVLAMGLNPSPSGETFRFFVLLEFGDGKVGFPPRNEPP